jgi:hypothetical protein
VKGVAAVPLVPNALLKVNGVAGLVLGAVLEVRPTWPGVLGLPKMKGVCPGVCAPFCAVALGKAGNDGAVNCFELCFVTGGEAVYGSAIRDMQLGN